MIAASVVDSEAIAARIEQELARVKAARPALASRVDRAANMLVTHLSCRRANIIKVRVAPLGGRPRFLVASQGSKGAVYVVDPASWSCTCPDAHRRGKACKHSIACWALAKAAGGPRRASEAAARHVLPGRARSGGGEDLEHAGGIIGRAVPMPRTPCDGCGYRFAQRDLVEVGPEQAEWTLAASEGNVLCRPCARRHGVV